MLLSTLVPVIALSTGYIIAIAVGVVLIGALIALYIAGSRMQKKQEAAEATMKAGAQTVSMLIIDKKRMKLKDAGFPDIVVQQTPRYLRGQKVPVVKAKVGPQIHTLMCDAKVFDFVPVKKEVKAEINGIYIINVKGLRGPLEAPNQKKGFFKRLADKAQKKVDEAKAQQQPAKKKRK